MDCLLNETLDISTVLDSTEHYKQWLADSNQALNLDASDVSRVDAAGIQALASLFNRRKKPTKSYLKQFTKSVDGWDHYFRTYDSHRC
ncbi:hypothetical protein ACFSJQ_19630 [Vibrio olivae]